MKHKQKCFNWSSQSVRVACVNVTMRKGASLSGNYKHCVMNEPQEQQRGGMMGENV